MSRPKRLAGHVHPQGGRCDLCPLRIKARTFAERRVLMRVHAGMWHGIRTSGSV